MGEMEVPADALYGAQTARRRELPHLRAARAPGVRRRHGAREARRRPSDAKLGLLPREGPRHRGGRARVLGGLHREHFVVDVYQAGAGTSHNMNVNEVLANRATSSWAAGAGSRSSPRTMT